LFTPFIRHDAFGEAGHAVSTLAAAKIALLTVTLLPARLFAALLCVAGYYVVIRVVGLLPDGVITRRLAAVWGRVWSRLCLLSLGFVRVRWFRAPPASAALPRANAAPANGGDTRPRWQVTTVSNHIGWADILVHMSRNLPSFVARDGTQDIPMIGLISRRIECIYVDREKKNGDGASAAAAGGSGSKPAAAASNGAAATAAAPAAKTNGNGGGNGGGVGDQVRRRVLHSWAHPEEEHRPMLLFPEGTTSNGECLLPFKTGAFLAGLPVAPVVIKYGASPVSPAWESISAVRHLLLMLTTPFHSVTCYELPVYYPTPEEAADPKLYAANVRRYMLEFSGLKPSPATLEDKRRYQANLRERLAAAAGK
jgi:lysophosphatidylcholine acyltransferase/lyso-PAF acetyltransferase